MLVPLAEAIVTAPRQPAAYVLLGSDGKYLYKGSCRNLQERLKDHQAGRASRTKHRRPLWLVHYECFDRYPLALRREKELKSGQGRRWLSDLLRQTGQTVQPKAGLPQAENLLA